MDGEHVKAQQIRHWDQVADGWGAWLDWTERNFAPVTEWFDQTAGWVAGAHALDVACGAGYPALHAARKIAPGGTMTAIDISPGMIAVASNRARASGAANISFARMDAEALQYKTAQFDSVSNAFGLMFCPDVRGALAEAHRVLRPGGSFAFATWDEPAQSPFFSVIAAVAASALRLAAPAPGAPGPFRLCSAVALETMIQEAGFTRVRVERRAATFDLRSVDEYCQVFSDVAWKTKMGMLSVDELARFKDSVTLAAEPYSNNGRLALVATSLCATGIKP